MKRWISALMCLTALALMTQLALAQGPGGGRGGPPGNDGGAGPAAGGNQGFDGGELPPPPPPPAADQGGANQGGTNQGGANQGGQGGQGGMHRPPPPPDPAMEFVHALAEANLRPDFNLSIDQKTQLAAILKNMHRPRPGEQGNQPPPNHPSAPPTAPPGGAQAGDQSHNQRPQGPGGGGELLTRIKAILNPSQLAVVESMVKEHQKEMRPNMERPHGANQGGPSDGAGGPPEAGQGGGPGGGPDGPGPQPNH